MANIVITKIMGSSFIRITSNDVETGWEYVDVWVEQLIGLYKNNQGTVVVAVDQGDLWELSYDGSGHSMQVDSVDGDAPTDNDNLIELIRGLRPNLQ